MKQFLITITYVELSGFYTNEYAIINAENESEAEELFEKYLESICDDRFMEHRTYPQLIDTESKGVVFMS